MSNRRSDVCCKTCGKIENLPNSRALNYVFCSKECMSNGYLRKRLPIIGELINNWQVVESKVLRKHGRSYIKVKCLCDDKTESDLPYSHLESKKSLGCKACSRFHTSKGYKLITGTFWSLIENSARKRNIEFSISIKDAWDLYLKQNKSCALSGISINFEPSTNKHENLRTCSLDRIDSKKGYTLDNIQWVHKDINIMKNRFNEDYFKDMIKKIMINENVKVKIKRLHPDSVLPTYAQDGDAGLDLTATSMNYDDYGNAVYGTGLAIEIPEGYVGYIFPRSSISKKTLTLTNSVGVIDSNYRGEIMFKFKFSNISIYSIGDRIGQLIIMPIPSIELEEVDELSDTNRGTGGFGSTGV